MGVIFHLVVLVRRLDLIMVLEAILTGRQPHEKSQCLYICVGESLSNNFRKTAVLPKKNRNCKLKLHNKVLYQQTLGAAAEKKVLYTNLQKILIRGFSAVNFVNKILSWVTLVYNSLKKPAV